ncbi:MAG: 1-acyl-sn-glycerol-3-phosphate acyltransferase [Synergistaceae bacterium]|nr:1-acyl-sn-glycerol-3-phosphate acyltransferase [Synergistaceae bacterium]
MLYNFVRIVAFTYFKLYHRLSIFGKDKVPKNKPVIFASNHASYLDPPVVGLAAYPTRLRFIAWDKLFKIPLFGTFLHAMGSVPVAAGDKMSSAGLLRMVIGFLESGASVFICPEGHRTEDGNLQALEGGVAILSLKTGVPIIPTWAGGTFRALSPHMKFPRPRKITVTFGDPIDPNFLPVGLDERGKRKYILNKIEDFYKQMDAKDREKYPR